MSDENRPLFQEAMEVKPGSKYIVEMTESFSKEAQNQIYERLEAWGHEHDVTFLLIGRGLKVMRAT